MHRATLAKTIVAGAALAVASIGVSSAADTEEPSAIPVVNKNGHEVNEHAADGQARAAAAHAAAEERKAAALQETDGSNKDTSKEQGPKPRYTDQGNHGGPNEHAGDHPNDDASTQGQGQGRGPSNANKDREHPQG